ncbi:MAG TPA: tetratricopeptide repeat protein [Kofleriaceae bacterium]|nr:tetratricopeptide repeat protein [Kofleriaceae bacterium]
MHVRLSLLLVMLAGCPSSKGPASKVQPTVPTVGGADPSAKPPSVEACKGGERHDLMVVDWTPEARGDLEVAMKEGVALLSYDCKTAKLVPACSLAGKYDYIGTTRREKKIEMSSADEIAANLPVGGLTWLSDVGGKFGRESALLANLVMVGKRSSAKKLAVRGDLQGSCGDATHFVRAATVGAFVVEAGSKAELEAGATVMGKGAKGGSKSSTKIQAQDGELEACQKSTPDGKTPPDQCGAVVRIELEPIASDPAAQPSELAVATCAPGFAMADGACVKLDKPHQCKPDDEADCQKQCDAGDAGSCATLAALHRDKDAAKAGELGKRACEKDVTLGCRVAGAAKLKKDRAGAIQLLDRGCQAGDGAACVDLGVAKLGDKKTEGDAQYAFRRACYGGGEVEGCAWLGTLYAEGKGGLSKSGKLASAFFEKGCKDGSGRACDGLAELYKSGTGVTKDAAKAKELFAKACAAGHQPACKKK